MDDCYWKMSSGGLRRFFWDMNPVEAKAFFDAYLASEGERLLQLQRSFVESGGGSSADLDYTPSSLAQLWRWAIPRIHKRELNEADPPPSPPGVAHQWRVDPRHFTDETLCLLNDIAYYFAEVFLRNLPGVKWEISANGLDRHADSNQPVLAGFRAPLNPRELVRGAGLRASMGNTNENRLLELFNIWAEDVGREESDSD